MVRSWDTASRPHPLACRCWLVMVTTSDMSVAGAIAAGGAGGTAGGVEGGGCEVTGGADSAPGCEVTAWAGAVRISNRGAAASRARRRDTWTSTEASRIRGG